MLCKRRTATVAVVATARVSVIILDSLLRSTTNRIGTGALETSLFVLFLLPHTPLREQTPKTHTNCKQQ